MGMKHQQSNLANFWVLAINEYRTCARLSRTKLILTLTFFVCAWYFVVVTLSHMHTSGVAPMFGVISPRYLASLLGGSFLALCNLGVLVLAYDMHSRDENNHINEVIATKPIGDIQFHLGRMFGIYMLMGIPLVSIVVLCVAYGLLSEIFAIPFGEPVEPWSVVSFLVLDVVPNFIVFGLLCLFLVSFIRPRFVALLLSVFCLYGWLWLTSRLPLSISAPLHTVTGNVIFPSDLIPTLFTAEILLNRVALVLIGFGFLFWLSVLYPRNLTNGTAPRRRGAYTAFAGVFLIASMYGTHFFDDRQISTWKQIHDEHFDPVSFPDVHRVEGDVDIYPGRSIELDLSMSVSVSGDSIGEFALFSFNPGYRIGQLSIDGKDVTDYQFRHGLLKIPRAHFTEEESTLQLTAKGKPNTQFAYLDSVDRVSNIFGPEVRQLRYLGTENYIFRSNFVVLMPGIKWYPVAGTATKEDFGEHRPQDFFAIDLNVSVPRKWIVAGPAQRRLQLEKKRTTYRLQTENSVPQLALVASRFVQASQTIEGIEFEVLYKGAHRRTIEQLLPAGKKLLEWAQGSLHDIRTAGFDYPFNVFSLVEVPASLRVYGGGSKMDTVLGMPGVLMMPETTLPTMHLDSLHDPDDFYFKDDENFTHEQWMEEKAGPIYRYFGIEQYAGNHLSHFYRSIFTDQTGATGSNADMLNLILEQVVELAFAEYEISFDFDLAIDREILDLTYIEPTHMLYILRRALDISSMGQLLELRESRTRKVSSDDVLAVVETTALANYDSAAAFDKIKHWARWTRAVAVSRVISDFFGLDSFHLVLAELLRRYRGQNFSYEDFVAVAREQGVDFETVVYDMMHSTGLPGFLLSSSSTKRIEADEEGSSRYQLTFVLENGEAVSGHCVLMPINHYSQDRNTDFALREQVFLERNQSIQFVYESSAPFYSIIVEPYLSLNRTDLRIELMALEDWVKEEELYDGLANFVSKDEVATELNENDMFIVIDDLDSGFSIVDPRGTMRFQPLTFLARQFVGTSANEKIGGLPAFQFNEAVVSNDTWERAKHPSAFGKYWKTATLNRKGGGETYAKFATTLPNSGVWRLEYFLPSEMFERVRRYGRSISTLITGFRRGTAILDIHIDSVVISESFDTSGLDLGWQTVGEYEIENADVEVWVSNKKNRGVVFADAIRWSPVHESN